MRKWVIKSVASISECYPKQWYKVFYNVNLCIMSKIQNNADAEISINSKIKFSTRKCSKKKKEKCLQWYDKNRMTSI